MAMRPGQTSRSRRGERVVQLAPACLAIVLGRESEPEGERMAAAGQAREPWPSGYQLFADFKAANASRFWDTRVSAGVRAARLAGWLHGGALLVRGERAQLDALRDAWGRRALRPPSGFTIRHVGDVRPILMVPAAQSHFIPLGDVLCAAIAQLSGRQQPVTQERLLQYLDQAFPGVPTPNQEVLHSTLGSLIKERKIYHTGEGYFIVTPQTYYVTSSLIRDDKKWVRSERDSPETCFPVLTPSNENNDCWQSPFGAHCLSCQCFHAEGNVSGEAKVEDKDGGLPMDVHNEKAQTKCAIEEKSKKVEKVNAKDLTANGVNGVRAESGRRKGKGVTSESKRRQLIGALPMLAEKNKKSDEKDSPASSGSGCKDKNHDLILSKAEREREGDKISKVFGLRLFRRSSQRKEKIPRKEHATFSAQFPPIEWPVRDEESQENLPRHLEHQIIRRINPELTVQNLLRHTALLEHVTSQATSRDAGTSTVIPAMRSRDKTRATNRRLASTGSRIRSRTHASRRRARALSSKVSSADEAVCHREETTEKPWTSRDLREQWIGPERPHSDEDILVDEAGHVSGQGAEEIPSWLQSWQRTQNNGDVVKRLSRRKGFVCRNNEGGQARKDHKAHHLKIRSKSVEPSKSKISMKHDFATAGDQHVTSHGRHQNALSNGLENTRNATIAQCEVTEKLMHGTFSTSNGINYQGFSRTQPIHHQRRPEITRKLYHFEPAEKDSCSLVNADIDGNQKNKHCDCNITDATGCTADYFNNNESRETIICAPEKPRTFKKHVRKEKQFRRNEGLNEVQNFVTVNSVVCKAIGEGNVHKKVHILKEHCSGEVAKINEVVLTQEAQRGLTCESESFTDEDCQLYVQDIQEDSDGSSLCLNEEDGGGDSPNSPLQVSGSYHCPPVHFLNKIEDSPTPCPSAIARDAGNSSQQQEMLMDRFNDSINGVFSNNRAVETTNFRDDQDVIAHRVQDGSKQERSGATRVRGKQLQISTPLMRLEEDIVEGFAGEIEGSIFDCNPNTEAEAFLEMANDDDEISDILSPRQSQGTLSQGDFECHRESTDQEGFNENPCLVSPDSSVSSTMDSGLPPSRAENTDLHNFIISSRSSSPRNGKFLTPSASMKMNTVKMQCQTTTNITSISGSSRNQNTTSEASELQTRLDHASKNTQDNTSQTVLRRTDNSVFIALKHEAPVNGMPLSKVSGNEQPADTDQWGQQSRPEQQKALAILRTRLARPLQEEQPSISNLEPQNMELGWTSGLSSRQIQSGSHLVNMSRTDSGTVGSREITGATFSLSPTINV